MMEKYDEKNHIVKERYRCHKLFFDDWSYADKFLIGIMSNNNI
ncbi:hypothetical protein EZS27_028516 [termite gut metagenome]|uniref:Uncharacterized protein n=1 Tax=termite gut metagenome TaxID=433724 RepID=A0A5J4QIW9_9ZZZZ